MNLELKPEMSFEGMTSVLTNQCPEYKIKLLKNPVAKFQYIQVEKSALVGIWIRVMEKKEHYKINKYDAFHPCENSIAWLSLYTYSARLYECITKQGAT
jgi:hypothetical protein